MTTITSKHQIETEKYLCTMIDAPGDHTYSTTLMRTMNLADAAILMVSAIPG